MGGRFEFELAVETLAGCLAARTGGAHRVELCQRLELGGLTPAWPLVERAVAEAGLPVHVLIRPHADGFCYDAAALKDMHGAVRQARSLGAAGVVLGVLRRDGRVDGARTRDLVETAAGLPVTFHRAFDETSGPLLDALEDVVATGCRRLLTSGRANHVVAGALALQHLVAAAGSRMRVAAGGGLRIENARALAQQIHGADFHGSLRYLHDDDAAVTAGEVEELLAELQAGERSSE